MANNGVADSKAAASLAASSIEQIRLNLNDDWKVLSSIYNLLLDGKAFCFSDTDRVKEKIVEFVQPNELKTLIDLKLEESSSHSAEEIKEIIKTVLKYSVKTGHPRFHNQLFGQMDPYGLAGAWVTEALNTSAYTFEVAPVFSLMETEIIQKVCAIAGYTKGDGIFAPGGSISNMYALVMARYKKNPKVKSSGVFNMRPLVMFTSEEAHYSFRKAVHWLGFGLDNCVLVKTNDRGQMLIRDLELQIQHVIADGREPFFVNATAGTTVLGAFDDFNGVADICEKYKLWLHIDACLGGSTLISHQNRHLMNGIERSHSFAWNPHKTLGAPLQCSLFLTREVELLSLCNSLDVNYLFQQDKFYEVSYDTGNKSIQCGRKIDVFKFWLMLKARGYGAYGRLVDHAIDMSKLFVKKLKDRGHDKFHLVLTSYQYTNICFWYIPTALRGKPQTPEWKEQLYTVAPKVKELMIYKGSLMIGYSPLHYRNHGNFFRLVFTCFPIIDEKEIDFILDEIEALGEQCQF